VSEIVQLKAPEQTIEVNKNWTDNFLHWHRDHLARYWSTSLTTVRGGAANRGAVDAWFNLLEETVQQYNIHPESLFNMDETCVAFGRLPTKSCHIGASGQCQQINLSDGNRETATMCTLISASGDFYPPTIIFKGSQLQGKADMKNPLDAL